MSEPTIIVKGKIYSQSYKEFDEGLYDSGIYPDAYVYGYACGQHDLVAAGYADMSHYRRCSPDELPKTESAILLSFTKDATGNDVYKGYYDIGEQQFWFMDGEGEQFLSLDEMNRQGFEYWAYLYLPPAAPQTTNNESKE